MAAAMRSRFSGRRSVSAQALTEVVTNPRKCHYSARDVIGASVVFFESLGFVLVDLIELQRKTVV